MDGYDYSNKGKARFEIEDGFYDELYNKLNGQIVAKFTLNKVWNYKVDCNKTLEEIGYNPYGIEVCGIDDITKPLIKGSCLTLKEMYEYAPYKNLYAWHIDNLEILKKPMKLNDFYRNNYQVIQDYESCNNYDCIYAVNNSVLGDDGYCPVDECPKLRISRPPQSWGYAYKDIEYIFKHLKVVGH